MTDISFYHLLHQPLHSALPKLLAKVQAAGLRAVVKVGTKEHMEELDDLLWSFDKNSFLPHATMQGKYAEQQPVYLTTGDENPAKATVLVLVDNREAENMSEYDRCLELFDGTDQEAVSKARIRWKTYKEANYDLTYWQQTEQGGWDKKG